MRNLSLRALLPAAALILGAAAFGWADCAPFVSSSQGDKPMIGTLVGKETRTESESSSFNLKVAMPGVEMTASKSKSSSRTYEVGTYDFGNGVKYQLDCSTYKIV